MTINRAMLEMSDYKGFAKKKHSSLLGFFKDKGWKFYNIEYFCQCFKTFFIICKEAYLVKYYATAYTCEVLHSHGGLLATTANIRLGWKCSTNTNAAAYLSRQGILKGEVSLYVPLTSCLPGLESAVWLLTVFVFICKTG
jgi:hypothetical protein